MSPVTRRALLTAAGATISTAALAVAIVPTVMADEVCSLPIDPEIEGLTGLPLAAVHIERAIEAMADLTSGHWSVTIKSRDRDQSWGFKHINPYPVASEQDAPPPQTGIQRMEQVIARHSRIWLAFESSCDQADARSQNFKGEAGMRLNNRLNDLEEKALAALMAEVPRGAAASNRKGTYLLTSIGAGGRWEPDHENVSALLSSLL